MNYNELINIEFLSGIDIEVACMEAITLAQKRNAVVFFDFNGIKMRAYHFSNPKELIRDFHKRIRKN